MTQQLVEAQEKQTKAESECGSLRDSVRSLKDVWGREVRGLKEEMRKGEERWRGGKEEAVSAGLLARREGVLIVSGTSTWHSSSSYKRNREFFIRIL